MTENIKTNIETIEEVKTPRKYKSQKRAKLLSTIFAYVLLVILSIIWLYPILWIVLHSFRLENNEVPVGWYFPKTYGFQNYIDLFKETLFMRWFGNTLLVAVCSCVLSTILILSVAYCMSKLRFKMRKPFMNISMILGLFPGFMSMIAIYYVLKSLKLDGSLAALILVNSAGAGMGFQIAKGYFDVVPNSLVESARLDGCSNFEIFYRIVLPLSKPIIIYTALMSFTGP
jgi:arabinogalactan oligomer/maltooligosaccharide transport system permease protein